MRHSIDAENWSYSRLQNGKYSMGLFLGGDPETISQNQYLYYLTMLEGEDKEIFQKEFHSLFEALNYMNATYSDWEFHDLRVKKEGCGSCSAH